MLHYWVRASFLKAQNWHGQIWYLITGGSKWPGNTTIECRSHGIFLNDTPLATSGIKITPSSKPPKLDFVDGWSLDMVFLVRNEWNFQQKLQI